MLESGGSSPRLWGTPLRYAAEVDGVRFIPTPVGNTRHCGSSLGRSSVHPHACGEHCPWAALKPGCTGSSPRLWGTHGDRHVLRHPARFIPTPVGNTNSVLKKTIGYSVHPHACGEHILYSFSSEGVSGSSPRLWGTHFRLQHCRPDPRFIPTPVGNTTR